MGPGHYKKAQASSVNPDKTSCNATISSDFAPGFFLSDHVFETVEKLLYHCQQLEASCPSSAEEQWSLEV